MARKDKINVYVENKEWMWTIANSNGEVFLKSVRGFSLKTYAIKQANSFAKRHRADTFDVTVQERSAETDAANKGAWVNK